MNNFNTCIRPYLKQYKWLMIATIVLNLTFITAGLLTFTSGYLITRAAETLITF